MKTLPHVRLPFAVLVGLLALAGGLHAQCTQIVPYGPGSVPLGAAPFRRLAPLPGGRVLAIGVSQAGGQSWSGLAQFDGAAWSPFGLPLAGLAVNSTTLLPNGDLLVCGLPDASAPSPVAVQQAGTWSFLGSLAASWVQCLLPLPNGQVIAGGWFADGSRLMVARFDGTAWQPMGAGFDEEVRTLVALPDGSVVAGGWFGASAVPVSGIARFDGVAWQPIGGGVGPAGSVVEALCVSANGDLIAAGTFTSAGGGPASRIARWDGAAWHALGSGLNGPVASLALLPDGDLLATGSFTMAGGVPAVGVARWNGLAWSSVGLANTGIFSSVARLAGDVYVVSGDFGGAGLIGITTGCPASVSAAGPGCAGQHLAAARPWTGAPMVATATGLPGAALVGLVYGNVLAPLPLAPAFATALPGCQLHVRPDWLDLTIAIAGQCRSSFDVPDVPALAGVVVHHQMVTLALDPSLAVAATDAVSLTLGAF